MSAMAYGHFETRKLPDMKQRFEHDIDHIQSRVSDAFVKRAVQLLREP